FGRLENAWSSGSSWVCIFDSVSFQPPCLRPSPASSRASACSCGRRYLGGPVGSCADILLPGAARPTSRRRRQGRCPSAALSAILGVSVGRRGRRSIVCKARNHCVALCTLGGLVAAGRILRRRESLWVEGSALGCTEMKRMSGRLSSDRLSKQR